MTLRIASPSPELILAEFKNWLETLPEEEKDKVISWSKGRPYTPRTLMRAIARDEEFRKLIIKALKRLDTLGTM